MHTPVQPAPTTTSTRTPAAAGRFRGQGRQPLWQRPEQVSVIALTLVVAADRERRRLQQLFVAMRSSARCSAT